METEHGQKNYNPVNQPEPDPVSFHFKIPENPITQRQNGKREKIIVKTSDYGDGDRKYSDINTH